MFLQPIRIWTNILLGWRKKYSLFKTYNRFFYSDINIMIDTLLYEIGGNGKIYEKEAFYYVGKNRTLY